MYLFIATHLGSGSPELSSRLSNHVRLSRSTQLIYNHARDLIEMKKESFKQIYFDELFFNFQFSCKSLYKDCKFIYLIREPKESLHEITKLNYSNQSAFNYYCFRMRRLCEMAKQTPGALFLTYENLISNKATKAIQNYLGLKNPIQELNVQESKSDFPYVLHQKAQDSFNRYFSYMNKLDLIRV
jgi:hypothetical protein